MKDNNFVNLGKRIREKRLSQNLTQEALAEKADVGTTHISHIETGCTKLSLTTFISIANALDVSADELLCDCINQASNVYETEISLLLKNCSTKEICFIHLCNSMFYLNTCIHLNKIIFSEFIKQKFYCTCTFVVYSFCHFDRYISHFFS